MEDPEGVVGLLQLAACQLRDQRGEGTRDDRCAAQVVAGRGSTPSVVGAEGVTRPSKPGPGREAEDEDDGGEASAAESAPRRANALAAKTCAIGQLGTVLPEP